MPKEINWLKSKRLKQIVYFGILFFPITIYLVPFTWIEHQHSVCLYKNFTGHECFGCGMTRAIFSALHFQFIIAFNYNKLFVVVLPLLIYVWIMKVIKYFHYIGCNKINSI